MKEFLGCVAFHASIKTPVKVYRHGFIRKEFLEMFFKVSAVIFCSELRMCFCPEYILITSL